MSPRSIVPFIVLVALLSMSFQPAGGSSWDMEVTVTMPDPVLTWEDGHVTVDIDGMNQLASSDSYVLPVGTVTIDLPTGQRVASFTVIETTETLMVDASPRLAGEQRALSDDSASTSSSMAMTQGDGVATFAVSPVEMVDGDMEFHRSITFLIDLESDGVDPSTTFDLYDEVIIAPASLEDEFQRLADWKGNRSTSASWLTDSRCVVIALEDILADPDNWGDPSSHGGSGNDTATKVRNFIGYAYTTLGADSFLLGADVSAIPAREASLSIPESEDVTTDQYYCCLDGDWDDDGDGRYAESGEADLVPDVLLGRAPVDTVDDVRNFVDKVIDYELSCAEGRSDDVLMVANRLNSMPLTWGGDYKDIVADTLSFEVDTLYERDDTYDLSALTTALDDSPYLVNHMGHGQTEAFGSSGEYFTISSAEALTNEHPFVLFSQACHIGGFQNDDCLSEVLVTAEHGAAATVTNTHYGWYEPGGTDSSTQDFDIRFFQNLADGNSSSIGGIVDLMRSDLLAQTIDDPYYTWSFMSMNLLGDPGMFITLAEDVGDGIDMVSLECRSAVLGETSSLDVVVANHEGYAREGTLTLSVDGARSGTVNVTIDPYSSAESTLTWVPMTQPQETLSVEMNMTDAGFNGTLIETVVVDVLRVIDDDINATTPFEVAGDLLITRNGSLVASAGTICHGTYGITVEGSMMVHGPVLGTMGPIRLVNGSLTLVSVTTDNVTVNGTGAIDVIGCDLTDTSIELDGNASMVDTSLTSGSMSSTRMSMSNVTSHDCPLIANSSGSFEDVSVSAASTGVSIDGQGPFTMLNVTVEGCETGISLTDCDEVSMTDVKSLANGRDLVIDSSITHVMMDGVHTTYGDVIDLHGSESVSVTGVAGALLDGCSNVTVGSLNMTVGLWVQGCDGVEVTDCEFSTTSMIRVNGSDDVLIWRNDILTDDVNVSDCSLDNGYPLAGNHWASHTSPDVRQGEGQDVTGSDGLVDEPFTVGDCVDRYPLVSSVRSSSTPPVAGIDCPDTVMTLDETEFTSTSTDDGHIVGWSWDLGDGTTANGPSVSHAYADDGSYLITLEVTDDRGMVDVCNVTIDVLNRAPSVSIQITGDVMQGELIVLNGIVSDGDGRIVSMHWDLGDGTTATEGSVSHTYDDMGTYKVTLTVKDDDGAESTAVKYVEVMGLSPTAAFDCPSEVLTGDTVTFVDASTDDGGIASWSWDLGDGTMSTTTSLTHTYVDDGVYTVTLTVMDVDGMSDSVSHEVTVQNRPPEPEISVDGEAVGGGVMTLTDIGQDPDGDIVSWTWYLDGVELSTGNPVQMVGEAGDHVILLEVVDDDGSMSNVSVALHVTDAMPTIEVTPPEGAITLVPIDIGYTANDVEGPVATVIGCPGASIDGDTVTFPTPGTWVVTLTATDTYGNVVNASIDVDVGNRAPSGTIAWEETSPLTVAVEVVASDVDGDVTGVTVTVDGVSYNGTSVEHRFASPGEHVLTVVVRDGDGGETAITENVTVHSDVRFDEMDIGTSAASFSVLWDGEIPTGVRVTVSVDGEEVTTVSVENGEVTSVPIDVGWGVHEVSLTLLTEMDYDVSDNSVTKDVIGGYDVMAIAIVGAIALAAVIVTFIRRR